MITRLLFQLRPINLLIVALTQAITIFFLGQATTLIGEHYVNLTLLSIITLLITCAGYMINDYLDYETDKINVPQKARLNQKQTLLGYGFIVSLGFVLSLYLALKVNLLPYLSIYIISNLLLYLYSSHLKSMGTAGNFIVALFSAFVIGIVWLYFESLIKPLGDQFRILIMAFSSFIFLSSMSREIIKDCQDYKGDKASGLKTLPIKIGINKAVVFASFYLILLMFLNLLFTFYIWEMNFPWVAIISVIILLFELYLINKMLQKDRSNSFQQLSNLIKGLMGLGLLYFLTLAICI